MLAYHGTAKKFDTFDKNHIGNRDNGRFGKGLYFTTNINTALFYTITDNRLISNIDNVINVSLDINNPLMINQDEIIPQTIINNIKQIYNNKVDEYNNNIIDNDDIMFNLFGGADTQNYIINELNNQTISDIMIKHINKYPECLELAIKQAGFDSVIYRDGQEIVIFDIDKIKII